MVSIAACAATLVLSASPVRQVSDKAPASPQIPESMRLEHSAIHSALERAMKEPGGVGDAAQDLAKVLHPHFVREEQIALPPLGLLESLAAGVVVSDPRAVLEMTDALRRELPHMLQEHTRIRAAVEKLRAAARAARRPQYVRLADELALHARTEEEVLYPAAILVGDLVRARRQGTEHATTRYRSAGHRSAIAPKTP
jgi:iron-sulfur cluster repair protein YtfE (RIC family)